MTLYEICDELLAIGFGEEVPADMEAQLDTLLPALDQKFDNICRLLQEMEAHATAKRAEAKRLAGGAKTLEDRYEWLRSYLQRHLERIGMKEYRTPLFSATRTANSQPSVTFVGDVAALPPGLRKVTIEVDKKACLEVFKAGGQLPEGVEVKTGEHLRIR